MNVIRKALDGWTEDQWCKDRHIDQLGRQCLIGRMDTAAKGAELGVYSVARDALEQVINEYTDNKLAQWRHYLSVSKFNDDPETTFHDIIVVMEKAAARLDEMVV